MTAGWELESPIDLFVFSWHSEVRMDFLALSWAPAAVRKCSKGTCVLGTGRPCKAGAIWLGRNCTTGVIEVFYDLCLCLPRYWTWNCVRQSSRGSGRRSWNVCARRRARRGCGASIPSRRSCCSWTSRLIPTTGTKTCPELISLPTAIVATRSVDWCQGSSAARARYRLCRC